MKLPRVRLSVRRMMVAVAVVSLLMGLGRIGQRSAYFRQRAAFHARMEELYSSLLEDHRKRIVAGEREARHQADFLSKPASYPFKPVSLAPDFSLSLIASLPEERKIVERIAVTVSYNAAMHRKYERAAKRPWLHVVPDPPEPKW